MADHRGVAAVTQHRLHDQIREAALQLGLDGQQQQLAHFDQDNPPCPMACTLAAQFRADRTTRAGDQHGATTQPAADQRPVRQDRLAAEEIFDRHLFELARERMAEQDVVELGHHAERHAGALADGHYPLHADGIQRGDGDHQQFGGGLTDHGRGIFQRAQNRQALQLGALQMRGIVEQADRFEIARAAQVPHQGFGRLAGAEDQHTAGGDVGLQRLIVLPRAIQQTRGAQQRRQRERIDDQHRHRHAFEALVRQGHHDGEQADEAGFEDVEQIGDAGKAPQAAVQAHPPEHHRLDDQHQRGIDVPERQRRRVGQHRVASRVQQLPARPDHEEVVGDDGGTGHQAGKSVLPRRHKQRNPSSCAFPCAGAAKGRSRGSTTRWPRQPPTSAANSCMH
ncbi:hypothetical protein D3C71_1240630 [compost metagenome]